jgi:hypothetical protein
MPVLLQVMACEHADGASVAVDHEQVAQSQRSEEVVRALERPFVADARGRDVGDLLDLRFRLEVLVLKLCLQEQPVQLAVGTDHCARHTAHGTQHTAHAARVGARTPKQPMRHRCARRVPHLGRHCGSHP